MLERLKKWLQPDLEKPPVVITIHGYGRRTMHEMDNLVLWGQEDGLEVIQFDMFDIFKEDDCDWMKWVNRAKAKVDYYAMQDRDIYLVGFSMGGVIASYLAATCPVKRLVLIAPAFHYIHVETITSIITKGASVLLANDKHDKTEIELPKAFYGAFMTTVKELKRYIQEVHCPVLILHGDEDEVIPMRSSISAFDKIPHEKKRLMILHGGCHRLLMDEKVNWECYQLIRLFLNEQVIPEKPIPQAPDYLEELQAHRLAKRNEAPTNQDNQTTEKKVNI